MTKFKEFQQKVKDADKKLGRHAYEDVCSCISLEQNECNAQTRLGRRFQEHGEIVHAFLEVDA